MARALEYKTFPSLEYKRWTDSYTYWDRFLNILWTTSVPKSDEDALIYFGRVQHFGPDFDTVAFVQRKLNESGSKFHTLMWQYDGEYIELREQ